MKATTKDLGITKGTVDRLPRLAPFVSDVDRVFADFFNRGWLRPLGWRPPLAETEGYVPSIDVIDRENEVVVRAEVPGYGKDDIEVTVCDDGTLVLKGEMSSEAEEEKGSYYFSEITHGAFVRTVPLPAIVEETKAVATMSDGVLELTLPKKEVARRHNIAIA
jgi:HSP20 family protein